MKHKFFLMLFGIGAMLLAANQANAQTQTCADHNTVVARLAEHFGESRQSIGLRDDDSVVEIFVAMETGSWTITQTRPGGPTCLVAAGQAFQQLNAVLSRVERRTLFAAFCKTTAS
ncbi:hypothetical protein [Yoonia sp.]|uniref:hypothetical protein n=1 Tax=Yoonia sp. TaxID=2212373 RepID=UPI0019F94224|nr:hypothetical protein [Yoonia sp.]MBE0412023.1 hypothetical protein [Yoonia sp.]